MARKSPNSCISFMLDNDSGLIDGLLNIDKPGGCTSHDVVAHLRRLLQISRVGHAGTLDPQATGVLLIGLGQGTKLVQFLHEWPKSYRATLKLGKRTDTYDAAGTVVEVRPVGNLDADRVEATLLHFRGSITQTPPMYSALKRRGQRLYELARQGLDVAREPRRVQISRLALLDLTADMMRLEVECSSGTYIRVLADDIGTHLGCGAHLTALVRTAVGPFALEDALSPASIEAAVRQNDWQRHIISLSAAVATFPAVVVIPAAGRSLTNGIPPTPQGISSLVGRFEAGDTVVMFAEDGALLAIGTSTCRAADLEKMSHNAPVATLRRVFIERRSRQNPADGVP
jgi:tRNA pseudouridine55 synthase